MTLRHVGICYLILQALAATAWWCLLLAYPPSRSYFMAQGAPDSTLLAFFAADAILYIGTATLGAFAIWAKRAWSMALLYIHAGAAGYAALYCWALTAITGGDGLLGALLMSPSLAVPAWLCYRLK